MPLYEFYCNDCKKIFELILTRSSDATNQELCKCPTCKGNNTDKKIPLFRVAGRGDLRESTFHGCHDHDPGHGAHSHCHSKEDKAT